MDGPLLADQREFQCSHCNGRIVIPMSLPSTTGPCPHCGAIIISPAPVPVVIPVAAPAPVAAETSGPGVVASAEKVVSDKPLEKSSGKPLEKPPVRVVDSVPRRSSRTLMTAMGIAAILIAGAGLAVYFMAKEMGRNVVSGPVIPVADPVVTQNQFLRTGWQVEAKRVLREFLAAETVKEKCKWVLDGESLAPRLDEFYGGGRIDDSDTPAEAFSAFDLSMDDRKRGLFMMIYDRPPQFNMREFFRPIASLEVQYGVEDADLLLGSFALASNFSMDPVRVPAFFKKTKTGLKLDWDTFSQAKYHTLRNFLDMPEGRRKGVFRLLVVEDVPEQGRATAGTRRYRIADPASTADSARINVPIDSEVGRALSIINWRGVKDATPKTRTVTLELAWEGDPSPDLRISKFICWEFLGLGGEAAPAGR